MSGLPRGEVFLCDHTDDWAVAYEEESMMIMGAIKPFAAAIHHIGSTAVPGLKAKPIIDMAIELFNFEDGFQCIEPLKQLGYRHRILPELPDRRYFSKGEPRTHQLHMYLPGSKYLRQQLKFRNRLRADPDLADQYMKLKMKLSKTHSADKLAYTEGKTEFINFVVSAA